MKRGALVANAVVIMVLLAVLTAAALLAFNLLNLGKPPTLSIGFISEKPNDLYLSSVEAAAADINHSVRNLSPQPPQVKITKTEFKEAQHQFRELYSQGIRIFIVTTPQTYQKIRNLEHFTKCTTIPFYIVSEAAEENGPNLSLIQELRGYLALISHNNPSIKPLELVTVWENSEENTSLYDLIRQEVETNYTNLKLTLPVTYEASKYPRSDGVQAVAEISSRLVMHPSAHIFFLTPSRLNEVIATSNMNRDLSKEGRRWYARGIVDDSSLSLLDKEFYRKTSLTTLTFLAPDESRETLELLRRSIKDAKERSPGMYLKAMAYATIYKLHKSFTEALISQRKMERLTSDRKPLAAAITYTGLMQIPLGEWAVTKMIDTENYEVKDIPSHPLHRSELEKLGGRQGLEKCPNPFVQLWLHPSLVLPQVFIEFEDFKQVPELIVLPAQQGISVSLRCGGHLTSTKAHCVPSKFNQGDLTCSISTSASPASIAASTVKSKRSIDSGKNQGLSISTIWNTFEDKVSPIWSDLTPDVFKCTTSIAGCDFCFYYLATYNLTASPAACVGGCSLGAFASCSNLIVSSLVKTLDLT